MITIGDYVSSYLEDINGDFDLFNDDTDGDLTPDFADTDDDGDGTNTANEVEVTKYTNASLAVLKNEIKEVSLNDNQFFTALRRKMTVPTTRTLLPWLTPMAMESLII